MKYLVFLVWILFSQIIQSQNLFKKIKETAKQASENVILNKTKEKSTETMDSVLSKRTNKKSSKEQAVIKSKTVSQTDSIKPVYLKQYSKFDFTPGEMVVYFRDFTSDNIGELPVGWNTNGSGEVVTFNNVSGNWLKLMQNSTFLSDNTSFFDENFTVEFDLMFDNYGNELIYYPALYFGFLSSGDKSSNHNSLLGFPEEDFLTKIYLGLIADGNGSPMLQLESSEYGGEYFKSELKLFPKLEKLVGKPIHIAVQVQKERFRFWVNEDKVFDVPKAISASHKINQLYYQVSDSGLSDDKLGIFISNIRVAKGIPDLRKNLLSKGSFSTSAILFDTNKASIKPESYGILNEIGNILKTSQDLKIEIVGHTDNAGNEKDNLILSQKRALAIRDFLSNEFKIDSNRMKTAGKGEQFPISENNTPEGRAKNRRVEFIKI
ncbi:hypothetical protein GCM10007962_30370 [Yeosuana aromativorans]|uniref:OmpA-like domain-containing protein n=1 Tax=Yeosuana aromativorans TaxID=288019 RepID=A0A8J3FIU0_9FLAO|nr:OmpA family protein [Yeosuana aromativorans]GGK33868.1 hypothetical protein GCM10007962_30370 [Yeosuana aromativorans]